MKLIINIFIIILLFGCGTTKKIRQNEETHTVTQENMTISSGIDIKKNISTTDLSNTITSALKDISDSTVTEFAITVYDTDKTDSLGKSPVLAEVNGVTTKISKGINKEDTKKTEIKKTIISERIQDSINIIKQSNTETSIKSASEVIKKDTISIKGVVAIVLLVLFVVSVIFMYKKIKIFI